MYEERIFNLFIYFEGSKATKAGVRFHKMKGTDNEKTSYLRSNVETDHSQAKRLNLPRSFTPEEWRAQQRLGGELSFFNDTLIELRAPLNMVFCLTSIVNGEPKWDQQIGPDPFRGSEVTGFQREGTMVDYLVDYTNDEHFNLPRLINDDYFEAIKLLFNAKLYVSGAKLLMSCIDTLAFVNFGDTRGNFTLWLDEYCSLEPLGLTSNELWEFRNSILHMTNLDSRAVRKGQHSRITPFVGPLDCAAPQNSGDDKPFNLWKLVNIVTEGISKWGESYNNDPDKILQFIERYDTTVSDARIALIERNKIG